MPAAPELSKSRVDKAAHLLREWWARRDVAEISDEVAAAWIDVSAYRRLWYATPRPALAGVNMGLRSMAQKFSGARVSQRLKRTDRIISKLLHFKTMRLSQMEDIGGCRVILPDLVQLRTFEQRLRDVWGQNLIERLGNDYIASPRDTGYRAVHLVVNRNGRLIEIQLRTPSQHRWAVLVEAHENQTGEMLKRGVGNTDTLELFKNLGTAFAHIDSGTPIPPEVAAHLRRAGRGYL